MRGPDEDPSERPKKKELPPELMGRCGQGPPASSAYNYSIVYSLDLRLNRGMHTRASYVQLMVERGLIRTQTDELMVNTLGESTTHPGCGWEKEAARRGVPSSCAEKYGLNCLPRSTEELTASYYSNASASSSTSPPQPPRTRFPVEKLLYTYGVDLAFFGHVHDYERYFPVYDEVVLNGRAGWRPLTRLSIFIIFILWHHAFLSSPHPSSVK